jgi:hypothetical protein
MGVTVGVVGEVGSSPSHSVATGADDARIPDEPAAAVQEQIAPMDMTRAASSEIQGEKKQIESLISIFS